ncbi:MAG: Pyruvate carboxylase [Blastococcus sp.]|jgi:acetyl-CoA carboxylase biotin carboxylase subunit|nr:Pyruvate carboxylase [Blastococcus sp.]
MLRRVLVANRGEIAVRIVRACRELGIESVVAYSQADRDSLAVRESDRAVCIGPPRSEDSYLNQAAILTAAMGTGADAVHPGYGFLAENADFADACRDAGLTFVGPPGDVIRAMGNKLAARATAARLGVPLVPGSPQVRDVSEARAAIAEIGLPVLIKAAAGGGGRGIRIVREESQLDAALSGAAAEAEAAFGDGSLFIERYIERARHVEVQVLADRHGHTIHLGDRDCSLQRRYQKVVEEAPAPDLPDEVRNSMRTAAVRLAAGVGYENAGTVEFVYDRQRQEYHFLEMNTRIQVEHPVTEAVTGLDLVQLQLQIAGGSPLPVTQEDVTITGHAIECRVTAESAAEGFRPSPGRITRWSAPTGDGIRLDTHCFSGYVVPPFYDSLLGKLVTLAPNRQQAISRMLDALAGMDVQGIQTTIAYLTELVGSDEFRAFDISTTWIEQRAQAHLTPEGAPRR